MNRHDTHPDTEQLDRLRAGLLDEDPQSTRQLRAHLEHCPACRRRFEQPGHMLEHAPETELDRRRHQVLAQARPARRHRPLAAIAAGLAVVTVAFYLGHEAPPTQTDILAQHQTRDGKTATGAPPVPFEDLDFYLWLADRAGRRDSST
ncbi:MAG TPA: hypothetical protein ENJ79_10275 [Gammaproteobacteria bacterium]|nr:hypothetical protein [Gammaproteobacteria bacterium]